MKYCPNCRKLVAPRRVFSFWWFLALLGVFYLIYYPFKRRQCPSCGGKKFFASAPVASV